MAIGLANSELGLAGGSESVIRTTPKGAQAGANDIVDMPGTKTEVQALRRCRSARLVSTLTSPDSLQADAETFRDQSVGTTDCPHHEDERKCCGKCCDGEISVHSYPLVKLCALNAQEKVLVPHAGEG